MEKEVYPVLQLDSLVKKGVAVNLVLSGGGVKAVVHIALIEYLESIGIKIASISGSSAGSLVGALYGSGMRPQEILEFFKTAPIFKYNWLNPMKAGIFDSEKLATILEDKLIRQFEDLQVPLTVAASNIERNTAVSFDEGDLTKPLLASCAFPAVFSPVSIDGELYSDAGVTDNFPIQPFTGQRLPIIGSYVCKPSPKSSQELNSILKISQHANSLLIYSANTHKFEQTFATVEFSMDKYGVFDTKSIDHIYEDAKAYLDEQVLFGVKKQVA